MCICFLLVHTDFQSPNVPKQFPASFAALSFEAEVAKGMRKAIPARALEIILGDDFKGTDMVRLSSEIHRPSFKDWVFKIVFKTVFLLAT